MDNNSRDNPLELILLSLIFLSGQQNRSRRRQVDSARILAFELNVRLRLDLTDESLEDFVEILLTYAHELTMIRHDYLLGRITSKEAKDAQRMAALNAFMNLIP